MLRECFWHLGVCFKYFISYIRCLGFGIWESVCGGLLVKRCWSEISKVVDSKIYIDENSIKNIGNLLLIVMVKNIKKSPGDLRDCSMAAADYGQKWPPGGNTIILIERRYDENDIKSDKRKLCESIINMILCHCVPGHGHITTKVSTRHVIPPSTRQVKKINAHQNWN